MSFTQIIYDGNLNASSIAISEYFSYGHFIIFDTVNLSNDEGIEIGFTLTIDVPVIGRTLEKDVILPSETFAGTLDTFRVIDIPSEYSQSGYRMSCAFHSSRDVSGFRAYVIGDRSCTLKQVCDTTNQILTEARIKAISDFAIDTALVTNQLSQNAALLALGTGIGIALAPYTAGTSLAITPAVGSALVPGSTALGTSLLLLGGT
ncbi:MAG: hypothetical protein ACRC2R_16875 [Xenococcaceae cyanobacterium]